MDKHAFDFYCYDPKKPDQNGNLPGYFCSALATSEHPEYLHPFTREDFAKFRLFKIHGISAGFAIKPDGDIVSVHNNAAHAYPGLAPALLQKAILEGGTKLDHFDGPLNRIFAPFFPRVYEVQDWDDRYAPKGWKYPEVDVLQSYWATVKPPNWVYANYAGGRPCVIYRTLAK